MTPPQLYVSSCLACCFIWKESEKKAELQVEDENSSLSSGQQTFGSIVQQLSAEDGVNGRSHDLRLLGYQIAQRHSVLGGL